METEESRRLHYSKKEEFIRQEINNLLYEKGTWRLRFIRAIDALLREMGEVDAIRAITLLPTFRHAKTSIAEITRCVRLYHSLSRYLTDEEVARASFKRWYKFKMWIRQDTIYEILDDIEVRGKDQRKRLERKWLAVPTNEGAVFRDKYSKVPRKNPGCRWGRKNNPFKGEGSLLIDERDWEI